VGSRPAVSITITKYTRLVDASDKVYKLLAHGRWFSPGTSASSTTKAESGVKYQKSNQIKN